MNAPQIVVIALWAMGLGIVAEKHGQPRTGEYNIVTQMVMVAIDAAILYWGGFFE